MLSDGLSRALARYNIHYGWIVAGTTFLVMLATAGAMGSAGVLIQPLERSSAGPPNRSRRPLRCASSSLGCSVPSPPPS